MEIALKAISFDGTRGAGKTSQIAMLSRYLKSVGMNVSTLKMTDGDPIESGLIAIDFAENFLSKNNNGVVIFDGSIARPMVVDIMAGVSNKNLLEKYKTLINAYEKLDHKYSVANFLLVMDNMEECNRRIAKFKELTGQGNDQYVDLNQESDIVSGMRFFNNHIASKNIHFQVLDLVSEHSMLQINKMVIEKLSIKYDFPIPKRTSEDW